MCPYREVAMRAVFRVFAGGGQVFVLAPTTVLAKQHVATMAARLRPFGASVELLNRNVKESERTAVLKRWKDGETQVVVGTHILLNLKKEMYGNLKLLVIDEEQRFGVKHKDQISALKASVDVLTLSATPIPRTLHMAIAGFRDASLVGRAKGGRARDETSLPFLFPSVYGFLYCIIGLPIRVESAGWP